jgi:3-oxoacyl-[acyl-carrier-protein] synthase-3
MVDTTDEWIAQRTGIRERRIAETDQPTSALAIAAGRAALADARVDAEDVDLVVCCTATPDHFFPATACEVGHGIGAVRAGGFDLSAACSGFVIGLQTGAALVASGGYRNILVIGAEKLSSIVNWKDRSTCVLFGDGAGAALLTAFERAERGRILGGGAGMKGGSRDLLSVPAGGTYLPASAATVEQGLHFLHMDGRQVYRFAVRVFVEEVRRAMAEHGGVEALDLLVPHQVNQRIIEAAASELGLPMERVMVNIDRFGNTSAASVPIALEEAVRTGRVKAGNLVCCVAFGAGLTWGHTVLRW